MFRTATLGLLDERERTAVLPLVEGEIFSEIRDAAVRVSRGCTRILRSGGRHCSVALSHVGFAGACRS